MTSNIYHTKSDKSSLKENYPTEFISFLELNFRKQITRSNILELFNYIINQHYITGKLWIDIPYKKLVSILKGRYLSILEKLNDYLECDKVYSVSSMECMGYRVSDKFIKLYNNSNNITEFIKYIKNHMKNKTNIIPNTEQQTNTETNSIGVASGNLPENNINQINSGSSLNSPIMSTHSFCDFSIMIHRFDSDQSDYTIDLDQIQSATTSLFKLEDYKNERSLMCAVYCVKSNLSKILSGSIKTTISEKTGRHYDNITQLQKDFRLLLLKNHGKYAGQLDLKCCHGFIILNKMRSQITPDEFNNLFSLFSDINLWNRLMVVCDIDSKDKVKSKFQLFINGDKRQNTGNKIYDYFTLNHPSFTNILFSWKVRGYNLSNEIAKIESSVMHSTELQSYIKVSKINCDIVHDCLWLYGNVTEDLITHTAQFVLRLFKHIYNYDMVFTLEVINKEKEIIKYDDFMELSKQHKEDILKEKWFELYNKAELYRTRYFSGDKSIKDKWLQYEQDKKDFKMKYESEILKWI